MEDRHRTSAPSIMESIMNPQRPAALTASSVGPRGKAKPGGQSRAMRRARTADRTKKVTKIQANQAKVARINRERLDVAASLARVYFAGPPVQQKQVGKSAFARVHERVMKQADELVAAGRASTIEDAVEQIETSMAESIRLHALG